MPYCLDGRQFHQIISEEAREAQAELQVALRGALTVFSAEVLETTSRLLEDPYLLSLIDLADWLERWIRIEDGWENPEYMKLSMIDDRRTSIEAYKVFIGLLSDLDTYLTGITDR